MWTLVDDLDAFLQEHRRCGKMDSGVKEKCVWMSCNCGAEMVQPLTGQSTLSDVLD